ncbi:Stress up-regulated Nod 19 [Cucumis melo var. makuwa]|uniref:Stress up-regulated Nod 19 n=1 Tax=Cucumis melo var. makuwa TaxID=1194695 RepID=A0A5D3DY24_CUCMM|nr:Stress up-regulated Nod 19 [Cucumis melo var. makuwa]
MLLPLVLVMMTMISCLEAVGTNNNYNNPMNMVIKTQTFSTPSFTITPGLVIENYYYNINFPKSHIAIKSFDVEVVDESGNQIPLPQTYLHHWELVRYYQHKNATNPTINTPYHELQEPNFIMASNNGVCGRNVLTAFYALGSESRKLSTFLPYPYGIEVGNPKEIPADYEERWSLNVHAIDTRGAENKLGCIECHCHLYNITKDRFGRPLTEDYKGGLQCCYDKTKCRVNVSDGEDFQERNLFVRYRVKWVDWNDFVIPLKVYLFDVTDKPLPGSTGASQQHHCLVEYDVEAESCSLTKRLDDSKCNAVKKSKVMFPTSGYLIYGVASQHIGATGAAFYGEDGRVLCSSSPIYGEGNEEGYMIGMTACYPKPGSIKINKGEMVTFVSNYSSTLTHIGVLGLFHIFVADEIFKSSSSTLSEEVSNDNIIVM